MYRIRFHGRGGQGVKTASRILGSAFFAEAYEVQDAPRYGAERRGAPIFAYVRAGRSPVLERGAISEPDLVVVVDEALIPQPGTGILEGLTPETVLLIAAERIPATLAETALRPGRIVVMPELGAIAAGRRAPLIATAAAGAAARLTGVIFAEALRQAIREELSSLPPDLLAENLELALSAFKRAGKYTGIVKESAEIPQGDPDRPNWILFPRQEPAREAPLILSKHTALLSRTGLWRTERPVVDVEACKRCWWICGTFCPDGVIAADEEGFPVIDYDHCKGCLICQAQCPSHAIQAVREGELQPDARRAQS